MERDQRVNDDVYTQQGRCSSRRHQQPPVGPPAHPSMMYVYKYAPAEGGGRKFLHLREGLLGRDQPHVVQLRQQLCVSCGSVSQ